MRGQILNSPRIKEIRQKRRKLLYRKMMIIFGLFIVLIVGLSFATKIKKINIQNIQVVGNSVIETGQIESVIREQIAGNYFHLFARSNSFLVSKKRIEESLLANLKRILSVEIKLTDLRTIKASVVEREGKYIWCDGLSEDTIAQKCYFTDDSGYIFDTAPYFSGSVYFKIYGGVGEGLSPIGSNILSEGEFGKIINFYNSIKTIIPANKPIFVLIKSDSTYEVVLEGSAGLVGPKIIFSKDNDIDKIAGNLSSALSSEPFASMFRAKYNDLLYIDLRFNDKVYYKFK